MVWWADRHWLLPKAVKHRRDIYCFRQKPGRREKKIAAGRVVLFFLFGRPPLNPTGRHRRSGHLWPLALILWSAPASGYRGKRHYNGRSVTFCNPTHHPTSVPVALAARATAPERTVPSSARVLASRQILASPCEGTPPPTKAGSL